MLLDMNGGNDRLKKLLKEGTEVNCYAQSAINKGDLIYLISDSGDIEESYSVGNYTNDQNTMLEFESKFVVRISGSHGIIPFNFAEAQFIGETGTVTVSVGYIKNGALTFSSGVGISTKWNQFYTYRNMENYFNHQRQSSDMYKGCTFSSRIGTGENYLFCFCLNCNETNKLNPTTDPTYAIHIYKEGEDYKVKNVTSMVFPDTSSYTRLDVDAIAIIPISENSSILRYLPFTYYDGSDRPVVPNSIYKEWAAVLTVNSNNVLSVGSRCAMGKIYPDGTNTNDGTLNPQYIREIFKVDYYDTASKVKLLYSYVGGTVPQSTYGQSGYYTQYLAVFSYTCNKDNKTITYGTPALLETVVGTSVNDTNCRIEGVVATDDYALVSWDKCLAQYNYQEYLVEVGLVNNEPVKSSSTYTYSNQQPGSIQCMYFNEETGNGIMSKSVYSQSASVWTYTVQPFYRSPSTGTITVGTAISNLNVAYIYNLTGDKYIMCKKDINSQSLFDYSIFSVNEGQITGQTSILGNGLANNLGGCSRYSGSVFIGNTGKQIFFVDIETGTSSLVFTVENPAENIYPFGDTRKQTEGLTRFPHNKMFLTFKADATYDTSTKQHTWVVDIKKYNIVNGDVVFDKSIVNGLTYTTSNITRNGRNKASSVLYPIMEDVLEGYILTHPTQGSDVTTVNLLLTSPVTSGYVHTGLPSSNVAYSDKDIETGDEDTVVLLNVN